MTNQQIIDRYYFEDNETADKVLGNLAYLADKGLESISISGLLSLLRNSEEKFHENNQ